MTMMTLKLTEGGSLDIPETSILLLEESEDRKACSIVYSLKQGENLSDVVSDNYGFIKKKVIDSKSLMKPLEVTCSGDKVRRLLIDESYIIARRELVDPENKHKTRLTLNVRGPIFTIDVLESRAKLDGED